MILPPGCRPRPQPDKGRSSSCSSERTSRWQGAYLWRSACQRCLGFTHPPELVVLVGDGGWFSLGDLRRRPSPWVGTQLHPAAAARRASAVLGREGVAASVGAFYGPAASPSPRGRHPSPQRSGACEALQALRAGPLFTSPALGYR